MKSIILTVVFLLTTHLVFAQYENIEPATYEIDNTEVVNLSDCNWPTSNVRNISQIEHENYEALFETHLLIKISNSGTTFQDLDGEILGDVDTINKVESYLKDIARNYLEKGKQPNIVILVHIDSPVSELRYLACDLSKFDVKFNQIGFYYHE